MTTSGQWTVVLMPGLQDVVVNNHSGASNTDSIGSYSRSRYNLSGFGNARTTSMTIGDVVFIADGKPYITFRQVSDPHGLASVVKSIRKAAKPYANWWTYPNRLKI